MLFRTWPLTLVAVSLAFASVDKTLPLERTSNDVVEISGTLLDKDEAAKEFGRDLGEGVIIMRTKVRPMSEKPVRIDYDDFILLDTDTGQRSSPYEASQIAGKGALVVTPNGVRNAGMGSAPRGPSLSGLGLPIGGGGIGNSSTTTRDVKVETETGDNTKPNPLLDALKAKLLPETEVSETTTGLLIFQLEGKKIKPKNLELTYKTQSGRLMMRFKQ